MATMTSNISGSCAPVARPSGGALILGVVIAAVTLPIPVPQALKVIRTQSSHGVSVPTLQLTIAMCWANIISTVAVKWRTITSCVEDGPDCLGGLLDLLQQTASAASWMLTLACVLAYPPAHSRRNLASTAVLMVIVCGCVGSSLSLVVAQPCSPATLQLATAYGWVASVCAATQYAPQILTTTAEGGSGSLSYTTYGFNIALGIAVAVNEIDFQRDTMPVWAPVAMSVASQIAVVTLSLYYDIRKKRSRHARSAYPKSVSAQPTSDSQGDELNAEETIIPPGVVFESPQSPARRGGGGGGGGRGNNVSLSFEQESGVHPHPAPAVARTSTYTDASTLANPLLLPSSVFRLGMG